MTVDYHYHFNRCMKNPSFISEDYCVTVSITINTTILSITTRLLFAHFFNLHVYIFYISVQLTAVWLFVFKVKLNWPTARRPCSFMQSIIQACSAAETRSPKQGRILDLLVAGYAHMSQSSILEGGSTTTTCSLAIFLTRRRANASNRWHFRVRAMLS